jgi:hypothetical protein
LKPIFTIHAGEYLVGSHIEKRFKKFRVWVPSKDTGIDLLLTNSIKNKRVGLQVKFSKDFLAPGTVPAFHKGLLACGWWTLNRDKIKNSKADFWIFVLYSFDNRMVQYLMIRPQKLLGILKAIHGNVKNINVYFWVTAKNKCWETRGLNRSDQNLIALNKYSNSIRNVTQFLNDWDSIKKRLT